MPSITFNCACCGKIVTGMPDVSFDAPFHYLDLPKSERSGRAKRNSDLCVIDDEDRFVRAVCPIPIVGADSSFAWCVGFP